MNSNMNNYNPQQMNMMINEFQKMMNNNIMGNNIMVMGENNNINAQEINNMNLIFNMYLNFFQSPIVSNNNIPCNINGIQMLGKSMIIMPILVIKLLLEKVEKNIFILKLTIVI